MNVPSRLTLVAVSAIAAITLSGCGAGAPSPTGSPVSGGSLTISEAADTSELDPQTSLYDSSWRLQDLVYDSLVTTNSASEILPSIAESWTDDGTSYTFTLRDDVAFSNGRPLAASDVVGSFPRLLSPDTGSYWAAQLGPVTDVVEVDAQTVRFDLATPWAPFLASLASVSAAILPMEEIEAGTFDPTTEMLGTGPFQFEEHVQDQQWTFTANPEYWGADEVALGEVIVRIVPDDSARIAALRDGSTDIAYFANPDSSTLLAGVPDVETVVQESSDVYWLALNSVSPESPFVELDLRRATATAVDRAALVNTALAGSGLPTAIASAGLPGSCSPDALPTYGGTSEEAAELLADAGLAGTGFDILSPPYLSTFDPIAQVLQQGFTDAGLDATIETPEMGAYIDRVYVQNPSDFDALIDYYAGYLYPTMAIQNLVVDPANPNELSGFLSVTPGLEELLNVANTSSDPEERSQALEDLCVLVAETANVVPLATKSTTIGVRTDQVDAEIPTFDGYDIYLRNITEYTELG